MKNRNGIQMVNLTSRDKRKPAAKNALIDTAFRAPPSSTAARATSSPAACWSRPAA
jgi:hypothetical protein